MKKEPWEHPLCTRTFLDTGTNFEFFRSGAAGSVSVYRNALSGTGSAEDYSAKKQKLPTAKNESP